MMDRKSESESKDKIDRESLLDFYIKNNYLKKTKRPDTSGEDQEYDFTWGPRSKIEFPTTNVVNFMLNVSLAKKQIFCFYIDSSLLLFYSSIT